MKTHCPPHVPARGDTFNHPKCRPLLDTQVFPCNRCLFHQSNGENQQAIYLTACCDAYQGCLLAWGLITDTFLTRAGGEIAMNEVSFCTLAESACGSQSWYLIDDRGGYGREVAHRDTLSRKLLDNTAMGRHNCRWIHTILVGKSDKYVLHQFAEGCGPPRSCLLPQRSCVPSPVARGERLFATATDEVVSWRPVGSARWCRSRCERRRVETWW